MCGCTNRCHTTSGTSAFATKIETIAARTVAIGQPAHFAIKPESPPFSLGEVARLAASGQIGGCVRGIGETLIGNQPIPVVRVRARQRSRQFLRVAPHAPGRYRERRSVERDSHEASVG